MISIGLGDIAAFPFLQPPDSRGIQDGVDLLRELDAISIDPTTKHTRITPIGRDLAQLPLDPRFGRMLVESKKHGVVREVAVIVAALSIQDVRERPLAKRPQADQPHARFADPTSDFLSFLALWNHLEEKQRELSSSAFRRLCKSEYLNYLRVREWQDLYRQLLRAGSLKAGAPTGRPGRHPPLAARRIALADRAARREGQGDRRQARQARTARVPRRAQHPVRDLPRLGAGEEGAAGGHGRRAGRDQPPVRPHGRRDRPGVGRGARGRPGEAQLRRAALGEEAGLGGRRREGDAVRRADRAEAAGAARPDRPRAGAGAVHPARAGRLDGQSGTGRTRSTATRCYAFDRENRALRDELTEVEERTRRRDILVDDEARRGLLRSPAARRPSPTCARFEKWWKDALGDPARPAHHDPRRAARRGRRGRARGRPDAYPAEWVAGDQRFRLAYRFEPGAEDDGVTVELPLALLGAGRAGRVQLARARPAGGAGHRAAQVAAEGDPQERRARGRLGAQAATRWSRSAADATRLETALAEAIRAQTYTPTSPDDFDARTGSPPTCA